MSQRFSIPIERSRHLVPYCSRRRLERVDDVYYLVDRILRSSMCEEEGR